LISRFFIDRPIFASVLSIVITLGGAISVFRLPIAQFPMITPPTIQVTCNYPGASALDVSTSVAAPIEEQVDGVEGMYYMSSNSTNDGSYALTVTFRHGVDLNMAQVLVQNRVNLALPSLPDVIRQTGVTVKKQSPDILLGLAITTTDEKRYDQLYLSNFALMQIRDELSRLDGISDVKLFGERDYSMRIWVDPNKLAARNMTADDVVRAIREQNTQVATGLVGAPPVVGKQDFEITLSTLGRLSDTDQFEDIILKSSGGNVVRVKDIGRVELGSKNEDVDVKLDGKPTVFLAIFQLPDANALDTYDQVIAKMHDLEKSFPEGVKWEIAFDTTPYTRESIQEVFKTLRDAVALVAVVVLVFLRNWRSSLIPMIAVPVAIIGTFVAMAALGFSLNNLTLFGLVLSIGIVVDDAIVVVESVEHHIEEGLPPREATIKAMEQVSGPVIAVGLVLSAVFVPCAFISGITGQFFRQFALTISVSTVISAFNSLTLSPALAALLLKPREKHSAPPLPWPAFVIAGGWLGWQFLAPQMVHRLTPEGFWLGAMPYVAAAIGAIGGGVISWPLNRLLALLFAAFNKLFNGLSIGYTWIVGLLLYATPIVLLIYGGLLYLTYQDLEKTPKGFIPGQDMGYLLCNVQLPDSASMERSEKVMAQLSDIAEHTPGVKHASAITGLSFVLNAFGSNFGSVFIGLKDYSERRDPSLSSDRIIASLTQQFAAKIYDAQVMVFPPPPVRGVGRAGGFMLMVEDRGDLGPKKLQEQTENLVAKAQQLNPGKLMVFPSPFRANVPQLKIAPDIHQCMEKGVTLRDFADTLEIYQGSLYVNDFNLFGRTWEVIVQAEPQFRNQINELPRLQVRNNAGNMVPLGSLASIQQVNGPLLISRYNSYPSAPINGTGLPGVSSADAIDMMAHTAKAELPPSMTFEWTDMAYLELLAGNTAMVIFGLAVVMVFLVLAAQYESWSLPMAVILVVPMCLLSAIIGVRMAAMDINIFTRIGFVVLVGLASKNAILIVEFAKHKRESGESRRQATLEACHLRLRPIIMTSLAFILGVLPLMLATGAGAEMRRTLGTAVFSGMLGVTVFGIFLTPVFFSTIDWLGGTPVFASWAMRYAGRLSINVISLRPVREYAYRLRIAKSDKRAGRRKSTQTTVVEAQSAESADAGKLASVNSNGLESNGHGVTRIDTLPLTGREAIFKK